MAVDLSARYYEYKNRMAVIIVAHTDDLAPEKRDNFTKIFISAITKKLVESNSEKYISMKKI